MGRYELVQRGVFDSSYVELKDDQTGLDLILYLESESDVLDYRMNDKQTYNSFTIWSPYIYVGDNLKIPCNNSMNNFYPELTKFREFQDIDDLGFVKLAQITSIPLEDLIGMRNFLKNIRK